MKVLLAAGANPLTANADNTTPLMVAAGVDMWNPGEDGGSTPDSEPEALDAVKMLVELGNDVNAANDRGETALHGAAYRGANTIVQYLVEKGAKIDARSKQGWTPWTIANGVFYSLFFKEQKHTADFLAKLMADARHLDRRDGRRRPHLLRLRAQQPGRSRRRGPPRRATGAGRRAADRDRQAESTGVLTPQGRPGLRVRRLLFRCAQDKGFAALPAVADPRFQRSVRLPGISDHLREVVSAILEGRAVGGDR